MEKVDNIIYFLDLLNEGAGGDDLREVLEIGQRFPRVKSAFVGDQSFFMVYEGEATEKEIEDVFEGKEIEDVLEMIEKKLVGIPPKPKRR